MLILDLETLQPVEFTSNEHVRNNKGKTLTRTVMIQSKECQISVLVNQNLDYKDRNYVGVHITGSKELPAQSYTGALISALLSFCQSDCATLVK